MDKHIIDTSNNRIKKCFSFQKNSKKGFTLVELIVVLVILAILAAILVPALLGYIDKAREKKDLVIAKYCLEAAQAQLTEEYAKNSMNLKQGGCNSLEYLIIPPKQGKTKAENNNGDVNATSTVGAPNRFADSVIELIEKKDHVNVNQYDNNDPMVIIMGVGSNIKNSNCTLHEKYTVYYLMYQQTKDSIPLFYYDGQWTTTNPTLDKSKFTDRYNPKVGPLAGKKMQYYIISNKISEKVYEGKKTVFAGSSDFWKYVDSFK